MPRKTEQDPTGQARNRAKSERKLSRRLELAYPQVMALVKAVPKERRRVTKITNDSGIQVFYDYDFGPQAQLQMENEINEIFQALFEISQDQPPFDWFFEPDIEIPYRQGAIEEATTFNKLVTEIPEQARPSLLAPLSIENILVSQPYRENVESHVVDSWRSIKSLGDRTSSQIMGVISRGMNAGLTPTRIRDQIKERFGVAESSANRIVRTEINKAYTDAKMELGEETSRQYGVRTAVMHISALIPTTRASHAKRHGNTYTYAQQREWWSTADNGSARINCYCDVESVLIGKDGQPINKEKQAKLKEQRESYFGIK